MRITCPNCGAGYDVAEAAIGPHGRKVRCLTCGAAWAEAGRMPPPPASAPAPIPPSLVPARKAAPIAPPPPPPPPAQPAPKPTAPPVEPVVGEAEIPPPRRRFRAPLVAFALVVVALVLGVAILGLVWGPRQLASELGLAKRRVPLGIAITREPDWREIAGGSELFAVSGRIWNPTAQTQPVPDVHAEIKDKKGYTIREWTIARPARQLAPGAHVDFDGAAVDVPRESATVALSFAGEKG